MTFFLHGWWLVCLEVEVSGHRGGGLKIWGMLKAAGSLISLDGLISAQKDAKGIAGITQHHTCYVQMITSLLCNAKIDVHPEIRDGKGLCC